MSIPVIAPGVEIPTDQERLEQWIRLDEQKRNDLQEANCDTALQINSLEDLRVTLKAMMGSIVGKDHQLLFDKLKPALTYLESFTNAITSMSQYSPVACLVWGSIQAFMESASIYNDISEEVVDMIIELNTALPNLEKWIKLFPDSPGLHYALQDLFEDFVDYCVKASVYFRRPPALTLFTNLFTSNPRRDLENTKKRMRLHVKKFQDAARSAHENQMQTQHRQIEQSLPKELTELPTEPLYSASAQSGRFPVNTVNSFPNRAFVGRKDLIDRAFKILTHVRHVGQVSHSTGMINLPYIEKTADGPSEEVAARKDGDRAPDASTNNDQSNSSDQPENDLVTSTANPHKESKQPSDRLVPATCVLHGLGGVGKTQIALEYYYRYRDDYDAAFWVESEHDWTLAESYARIADKLGLLPKKTSDAGGDEIQNIAIEAARSWLQTTKRNWLLIFDNVEDVQDLNQYMPLEAQSKGSIIVTTQKPITFPWVENIGFISVEAMSRDEAGRLLFSYLERDPRNLEEEESARELADYVGGLPLAIATIGGYLRQSETSVADFSKSVQYSSSLWTESSRVSGPASYERNLESVFNKAFKELSPPARSMLNILAFLNPDSIPEALFLNGIKAGILPFLKSKADLEKCRFELRQRQLVRRDTTGPDPFISIHRTVQWNVLLQLSEDKNHRWDVFKLAFELVRKMLPESSPLAVPEAENWPAYAVYGRQILELRTHCLWPEPPVELPVDFAQVLSDMGVYMWHSGKFPEGEKALGTAENILDDNNAPLSHPLRSNIYVVLGILSSFEGVSQRKYSFELRKKAYESRHASLDGVPKMKLTLEDEMRLWNVESDLAFGWVQQEDFEEAATIMEKCLEQYKIWDTEDKIPFEYSKYYQIMSFYHMARNDPIKAIHTITHCHKMMTQAANADHPMTQLINFCYANLIWHASEPVKALEINKVVLEHRKKILGEFSHFTLESYSTCGKLCEEAGELDNARSYLDTCLQRRKRAIWNEEGVARAQYRYARVLDRIAEREEAVGRIMDAEQVRLDATKRCKAVDGVLQRFRKDYPEYLPDTEDKEAILDQMVSLWAGRFTGRLKQPGADFAALNLSEDVGDMI